MFYEANIHNCTENSAIFHEICTEVGAIMNENCTGNSAASHSLITAFVLIVKLFNNLSGILPDSDAPLSIIILDFFPQNSLLK